MISTNTFLGEPPGYEHKTDSPNQKGSLEVSL